MNMRRRIERLEGQVAKWTQRKVEDMTDDELMFLICHGYPAEQMAFLTEPQTQQFTESGLRVTILLEPVK